MTTVDARGRDANEYILLEWMEDDGFYTADFEADGLIFVADLETIKERKKNLEASPDYNSDNSLDIFKLVKIEEIEDVPSQAIESSSEK